MRNRREDNITDTTEMHSMISGYFKQLYNNKSDNRKNKRPRQNDKMEEPQKKEQEEVMARDLIKTNIRCLSQNLKQEK